MAGSWLTELNQISADAWIIATVALLLLLPAIGLGAGQLARRRRSRAALQAVDNATVGRVVLRNRIGAGGFVASIVPPPEPFREFTVDFRYLPIRHPTDVQRRILGGQTSRLQLAGNLSELPSAEVVWARGYTPAQVLGSEPGRELWTFQRLDVVGTEYATRGTDVGAMRHILRDLRSRFGPVLKQVTVRRDRRPTVLLEVDGSTDLRDVSPLIISAQALGRAALLR